MPGWTKGRRGRAGRVPPWWCARVRRRHSMRDVLAWRDVRLVVCPLLRGPAPRRRHHLRRAGVAPLPGAEPPAGRSARQSSRSPRWRVKLVLAVVVVTVLLTLRLRWRLRLVVITLFAAVSLVAPLENLLHLPGWSDRSGRARPRPATPPTRASDPQTRTRPDGPARRRASASPAAGGSTAAPPPSIAARAAAEAARSPPTLVSTTSSAIPATRGSIASSCLSAMAPKTATTRRPPASSRPPAGAPPAPPGCARRRGAALACPRPTAAVPASAPRRRPATIAGSGMPSRTAVAAATARFSSCTRPRAATCSGGAESTRPRPDRARPPRPRVRGWCPASPRRPRARAVGAPTVRARSVMIERAGSVAAVTTQSPVFTIPAFSAAIASTVSPSHSRWSRATLVTTQPPRSATLVLSSRPPIPTSQTTVLRADGGRRRETP